MSLCFLCLYLFGDSTVWASVLSLFCLIVRLRSPCAHIMVFGLYFSVRFRGCSVFTFLFSILFICLFLSWVYLSLFILQSCFVAVYSLSGLFLLPVICFIARPPFSFFYFYFLSCFYWCLFAVWPQLSIFLFLVTVYCLVVILFWAFL